MLKIEKLRSGYNHQEVIHGIDLEVGSGEIAVLTGLNGSGKSTILKSIFNMADVYSGNIYFNNQDITNLPTQELIKKGIGYVPQGRQIFPDMTVKENLEMGAYIVNNSELVRKLVEKVFVRFPFLEQKKNDYAFTLSGGQQQILSFGRALILEPKIMLLDEPSLGLSLAMMGEVANEIKKMNSSGISFLIVEHNAKLVADIADKTYLVKDGIITAQKDRNGVEFLTKP